MAHLRAATQNDREDTIEEAGKSVDSAMKVLVNETGPAVSATGRVLGATSGFSDAWRR